MEDQAVSQSSATYEDAVAELVMLSQQLPVGSYWKDDRYMYKINLIKLSGIALAECTRITIVRPDDVEYSYHINNKILLFNNYTYINYKKNITYYIVYYLFIIKTNLLLKISKDKFR